MWIVDDRTIEWIENVIQESWDKKDYIKCLNSCNYLLELVPDNEIALEYKDILEDVDLKFEYVKYAKSFEKKTFFYMIFAIVLGWLTSFIFVEDYFQETLYWFMEAFIPIYFWYNYILWALFTPFFFAIYNKIFSFFIDKSAAVAVKNEWAAEEEDDDFEDEYDEYDDIDIKNSKSDDDSWFKF